MQLQHKPFTGFVKGSNHEDTLLSGHHIISVIEAAILAESAFIESQYIILSQNTFSAYVSLYL